jgi:hypothetical protein
LSVALTPVEEDDTTVALGKEPRVKAQGSYLLPFSRLEGQLPSAIKPQKGATYKLVPLQGSGRKEAHNVRLVWDHPRLDLTIAPFR